MNAERIELVTPADERYAPVIRLVLGGIADRLDMGLDDLDDLQLAVERLMAEAGGEDCVRMSCELSEQGLRTRIGPLRESVISEALQGPEPAPGEISLRVVLETVVDSYGVEHAEDGELMVRLEKRSRERH